MAEQLQAASKLLKKVDPNEVASQRANSIRLTKTSSTGSEDVVERGSMCSTPTAFANKNDRVMALTA